MMLPVISRGELNPAPVDWLGLHREYLQHGEMEVIAALVRNVDDPKVMIEIGCRDGRTAAVLLHNVPTLERYVGVDVPMEYEPVLPHQKAEMVALPGWFAHNDPRFEIVIRAKGSTDLTPDDLPRADAIFIDGDHSERVVLFDSFLARARIKPGGVIMWHDYCNGGVEVTRVLDRLRSEGWPIASVQTTWLAFMRV